MLSTSLSMTLRQRILAHFAEHTAGLTYALLKAPEGHLVGLPPESDLDLVVLRRELPAWEARLREWPGVKRAVFRRQGHATYAELYFADRSYLELDLLHILRRRHQVFLDAASVLAGARRGTGGVMVAHPVDSYAYLWLFYGLNGSAVPEKYRQWRLAQPPAVQDGIRAGLAQRFGLGDAPAWLDHPETVQAEVQARLREMPANQGLASWGQWLSAAWHRWQPPQPVITFSGVDGAGKSTILEAFQAMLTHKYRRQVVVLRHRPSLLPILSAWRYGQAEAEAKARNSLPRQGQNRNPLSSWLRFGYYYLDYLLGQWVIHFRYSRRGVVVLYDRYYFDFIVDGRRSNLAVAPALVQALYRLIRSPRLNVLLYASPARILARKQELDAETIRDLTTRYRALFARLQGPAPRPRYLAIDNQILAETLVTLEDAFTELT